jgi:hypothetical protein
MGLYDRKNNLKVRSAIMKQVIMCVVFLVIILFPGSLLDAGNSIKFSKLHEWGNLLHTYNDLVIQGDYVYCAAGEGGLVVLRGKYPTAPDRVSRTGTPGQAKALRVKGNYAYIADGLAGLQIYDISNPLAPVRVGFYHKASNHSIEKLAMWGTYVLAIDYYGKLLIIDVSNPTSPFLVNTYYENSWPIDDLDVEGNWLYVIQTHYTPGRQQHYSSTKGTVDSKFAILNITIPTNIFKMSEYEDKNIYYKGLKIRDGYAWVVESGVILYYLANPNELNPVRLWDSQNNVDKISFYGDYAYLLGSNYPDKTIEIWDVFNPGENDLESTFQSQNGSFTAIDFKDKYAWVSQWDDGIRVLDISDYSNPVSVAQYKPTNQTGAKKVCAANGNVYALDQVLGLVVLQKASNGQLTKAGDIPGIGGGDLENTQMNGLFVSGNYLYAALGEKGLDIVDVTDPFDPQVKGRYASVGGSVEMVWVKGNYAYIAEGSQGLKVLDISNPASPNPVGGVSTDGDYRDIAILDNYAYIADNTNGFVVINIADPASPVRKTVLNSVPDAEHVAVSGNYAFVSSSSSGNRTLYLIDISNPLQPVLLGQCDGTAQIGDLFIKGDRVYAANDSFGVAVYGVSTENEPELWGHHYTSSNATGITISDGHILVAGETVTVFSETLTQSQPQISLSRTNMIFSANNSGAVTGTQSFRISNSGGGTLNWTASSNQTWLTPSPLMGTGAGEVMVSIDATGLNLGTYHGTITVSDLYASNSPQYIAVQLTVYSSQQTGLPFGHFSTPLDGATVRSSIPVTGWALDDVGIQKVQIYRNNPEGTSLIYIGDADLVEGARPDVAQAYPGYPNNTRAGWGYMLLTNFLPDGGNGTFTLYAIATDTEGNSVTLDAKTIHCDNANAVDPFGALDTPSQGGTAAGFYTVWGWALTPMPNMIPTHGNTIHVWVDGKQLGSIDQYDLYRRDIATLFPDYANSIGAVGYYTLDTTKYSDGVHTIQWTVTDDADNTDGIGSRYFTINNTALRPQSRQQFPVIPKQRFTQPVNVRKGYDLNREPETVYPGKLGIIAIRIEANQRLDIQLPSGTEPLKPLPIGADLDSYGHFTWQLGPGFLAQHSLFFRTQEPGGQWQLIQIDINIDK